MLHTNKQVHLYSLQLNRDKNDAVVKNDKMHLTSFQLKVTLRLTSTSRIAYKRR